jgi:hypothetical protein
MDRQNVCADGYETDPVLLVDGRARLTSPYDTVCRLSPPVPRLQYVSAVLGSIPRPPPCKGGRTVLVRSSSCRKVASGYPKSPRVVMSRYARVMPCRVKAHREALCQRCLTTLLRGDGDAVWSVCMGVADRALRRRMSPDTIGSIHL